MNAIERLAALVTRTDDCEDPDCEECRPFREEAEAVAAITEVYRAAHRVIDAGSATYVSHMAFEALAAAVRRVEGEDA